MIGYVLLGVAALVGIYAISFYNGSVKMRNAVQEAFATMDVYLKKRFDLIPNLVETVKGYASHESATLEKVVQARSALQSATSPEDRFEKENVLQGTLRSIFALAEQYPDLKANENFGALQSELSYIESEIANSRKYYNAVVKQFNTRIEMFPGNIFAGIFGFERSPMFEISDEAERAAVAVDFS